MQFDLLGKPDFAMLKATFEDRTDSLVVESGAMVARDDDVAMKTSMRGGALAAAKRAVLGGESLFLNTFTPSKKGEVLYVAPAPEGDLLHRKLAGETLYAQSGAFVCSTPGVALDTKWGGAKGFLSGAGLFLLKCSGTGDLFLSSYGAIHEVQVENGFIADTGHIVAFEESLQFNIRKVGGLKGLFFSGEGLVCEFKGSGKLWLQTRNPSSLAMFLHGFRRVQRNNS